MPYKVKGKCVYKKDSGKKVGCTKGSVKKYLAALHMHADESLERESIKLTKQDLVEIIKEVINGTHLLHSMRLWNDANIGLRDHF